MQEELRARGDFREAEQVKQQLIELIQSFERKQLQRFDETALAKLEEMDRENEAQFGEFERHWDEKLAGYDEEAYALELQLQQKQREIRAGYEEELRERLRRTTKPSSRGLNLEARLAQLSKQNRFEEAAELKAQLEEERRGCAAKREGEVQAQVYRRLELVVKTQDKEYKSFLQKIGSNRNELVKAKDRGLAEMVAKFRAQRSFVENRIKLERASKIKFLERFDPVKNIKVSKMYAREEDALSQYDNSIHK